MFMYSELRGNYVNGYVNISLMHVVSETCLQTEWFLDVEGGFSVER